MITIQVQDNGVHAALQALAQRLGNLSPILKTIGEDLMERTKERFGTSTGPDGQRWKPNARATIEAFLDARGGFGKKGINKKGQGLAMGKKPLIASGLLANSFNVKLAADGRGVSVNTNWRAAEIKGGAAVHQFGSLNGRIPARPFFPIKSDGSLYPQEQSKILDALNAYLAGK